MWHCKEPNCVAVKYHALGLCRSHYGKRYRKDHAEEKRQYGKQWRKDNPEYNKQYNKQYGKQYRKDHTEEKRQYLNNRKKTDINFKLGCYLRTRLYIAIKRNFKSGSAVRDLGCSIPELKLHLESQFQPGMTWDNYGKWHIDHINPLVTFDLTDREQLLDAVHFTNLQPLWASENLHKGACVILVSQ